MDERQPPTKPSAFDQILDLLLDALLERQAARRASGKPIVASTAPSDEVTPTTFVPPERFPTSVAELVVMPERAVSFAVTSSEERPEPESISDTSTPEPSPPSESPSLLTGVEEASPDEADKTSPSPVPSIRLDRTLRRLLIALTAIVALVNIPLNASGVSLSRALPDGTSLIIRDGLVLKGSGPEIHVLENNKLRWITSLEAFEFFGFRWEQVHIVEDSFLNQFQKGRPKHVLLKCERSPHIYALEIDKKRWIKDIPTFEAEGFVWEDVKFVPCDYLRSLPDGLPIPADAGPPPQP